jgi:hypothetical protein
MTSLICVTTRYVCSFQTSIDELRVLMTDFKTTNIVFFSSLGCSAASLVLIILASLFSMDNTVGKMCTISFRERSIRHGEEVDTNNIRFFHFSLSSRYSSSSRSLPSWASPSSMRAFVFDCYRHVGRHSGSCI